MKTTAVLFEYLAIGILTLVSLLILYISLFPESSRVLSGLHKDQSWLGSGLLVGVLTAAAYSAGVVAESVGRICFEWLLDQKRPQRFLEYFNQNKGPFANSPVLKDFANGQKKVDDLNAIRVSLGAMRFHVMNESPNLYQEIEANVNKMRLIRPLFLVEIILLFAVGWRANALLAVASVLLVAAVPICVDVRDYSRRGRFAIYTACAVLSLVLAADLLRSWATDGYLERRFPWLVLAFTAWGTYQAISHRFDRYLRAIERSYKVLVLDAYEKGAC